MLLWVLLDALLFKVSLLNLSGEVVVLLLRASCQLLVCEASLISLFFVDLFQFMLTEYLVHKL